MDAPSKLLLSFSPYCSLVPYPDPLSCDHPIPNKNATLTHVKCWQGFSAADFGFPWNLTRHALGGCFIIPEQKWKGTLLEKRGQSWNTICIFYKSMEYRSGCCKFKKGYGITGNYETVHQLFVDFKKAYDSVRRNALYNIFSWNFGYTHETS
jgi:hypothetical protein